MRRVGLVLVALGISVAACGSPRPARPRAHAAPTASLQITGRVLDGDGLPVAGATVAITSEPPRTVTSELDGSFRFDQLTASTIRLEARHGHDRAGPVFLRVRDDTEPLVFNLHAGNTIAVTVVDADTKQPIAGAKVEVARQTANTGPDGVAVVDGLPSWFTPIGAAADGYASANRYTVLLDDPGGRFDVSIELHRGAMLSGVIVAPDGAPVVHGGVWASTKDGDRAGSARSDASGNWTFWCSKGEYDLFSSAEGMAISDPIRIESDGSTPRTGIALRLREGAVIAGFVTDAFGAPAVGATVAVADAKVFASVVTDDKGQFTLRGLEPRELRVWASSGDLASTLVAVTPGTPDAADVRFALVNGTIRGVVVDPNGKPVAAAQVHAHGASFAVQGAAVTDHGGRYVVGPLPSGLYELDATALGTRTEDRDVSDRRKTTARPASGNVTLALPATGTIIGRVEFAGKPPTHFGVAIHHFKAGLVSFATPWVVRSADGRFTRERVPEGIWLIAVVGNDFARTIVADIHVKAGEVTDLGTITVDVGSTITGQVVDTSGAPVAGADVEIGPYPNRQHARHEIAHPLDEQLAGVHTATTGADGTFTVNAIATNRWPLYAVARKDAGRSPEIEVEESGTVELVITP